jgi:glycine amidinotransferase
VGVGPVNSWNEWDPLEEVIVGSARGAADIGFEPGLGPFVGAEPSGRTFEGGRVDAAVVDEAERQLDGLADLLDGLGVRVRRPDPVDHRVAVRTPDWAVAGGRASACPRDALLVVGDEIIEAPMGLRARYFEFRAYRNLIQEYFRGGARWTAAPKPLLTDGLYDGASETRRLRELEPVFDAACFARCGRDIFWQPDLVSNQFGADWLGRHLGPDFRIHRIAFEERLPTHIDTTLVPIRPRLVLVNPARPSVGDGLEVFRTNGWEVVAAPPSVRSGRSAARDVSSWISMNVLMVDERTAVVEAAERPTIELLERLGCRVIPCAFDRVYAFGGGFHCCTTDIRRNGRVESYFPELD